MERLRQHADVLAGPIGIAVQGEADGVPWIVSAGALAYNIALWSAAEMPHGA